MGNFCFDIVVHREVHLHYKIFIKQYTMRTTIFTFFITALSFLFAQKNSLAQTTSTGTDFWMGFTYAFQPGETGTEYKLWISSVNGASGTVSVPLGAYSVPFVVAANSTTIISIPYAKVQNETSESIQPKGVHIISNGQVSVFGSMYSIVRPEATLVMATPALGTEYYVQSYPGYWYGQSHFEIVATQNGTSIQITPTSTTMGNKAAGIPYTITLDSGQVYLVRAKNAFGNPNCDMTGTKIIGTDPCKKFAVFGGAAEVDIPIGCGTADPIYEELQPVSTWGKDYIVPPFYTHTGSLCRIVASKANTSVVIDGAAPIILNAGQFNEQSFNGSAHCITADKPIEVAQFMKGNTCNGGTNFAGSKGDPCMLVLNSNDQLIKTATFRGFNQPVVPQHLVNIVMKTAYTAQLKLNGTTVTPNWTVAPNCTGYSYATLLPANITNGATHTISADSGFVGYAYGYGSGDASYAFPLGYGISSIPPSITGTLTICKGASTTLTATGGGTYVWAPGGQTTTSITISPSTTTTYTVTVNNSACPLSGASAIATVTVNTCGIIITTTNASMCSGECGNIIATVSSGTAPYIYSWSPGGSTTSMVRVCPTATSTFTVIATDASGISAIATAMVTIIPTPIANFTMSSTTVSPNTLVSFTDVSTGGSTLSWNFGDPLSGIANASTLTSVTHTYLKTGDYCITLISTNSNSCADTISKCLQVIGDPLIIIPNVFTPNGDGVNDVFYFYTEGVKELSCTIYDRWGLKMSEWNTVSGGWDGRTTSGSIASNGVYYFIMKATPANEKKEIIKQEGFVQLLKQN